MPTLGDELREVLKSLEPARRVGRDIMRMEAAIIAVVKIADRVVDLEAERKVLEQQTVVLQAKFAEEKSKLERERAITVQALEAELALIQTTAKQTKERVAKETKDFIAAREIDRQEVLKILQVEQRDLHNARTLRDQAEQDRQRESREAEAKWAERRQTVEPQLLALESRLAARRKDYEEIQARLQALVR